jgi:small subunit ribosomal protein S13
MLYIFETELLNNKSIFFSLQKIYGIGQNQAFLICKKLGFCINLKTSQLSSDQINTLIKYIDKSNLIITSELKKMQSLFLKNLVYIKTYRGLRKIQGLPVRGQRTHTNAKTARNKNKRSF